VAGWSLIGDYRNYTGDVLNFGLAKELAAVDRADRIRFVVVEDDVAVGREQGAIVGRRCRSLSRTETSFSINKLIYRGLAGTVLVYKIAGALAQRGGSLDEVHRTAQYVASRLVTIGVGLEHTHVRRYRTNHRSSLPCFYAGTWDGGF
jgi:triose/dihydroxyacetone kinase / FAD-AMP lyase (cyclizing)